MFIFQFIKKYVPGGIYIYYYLWQYFMYHKVKNENFVKKIDIVHHLTFGVFRIPSFLWKLNKKFIFGPVGGHEIMPHQFFKELNFNNKNQNIEIGNIGWFNYNETLEKIRDYNYEKINMFKNLFLSIKLFLLDLKFKINQLIKEKKII